MIGVRLRICGNVASDTMIPWICHRARLLDLKGWVTRDSDTSITLAVLGPQPLVDAMEVACSLGPGDVLVDNIARHAHRFESLPIRFETAKNQALA